jgi:DNA-binding Lrp family transcriptional regulator
MTQARPSLQARLTNEFQRDLCLVARPFVAIAEALGTDEQTVIDELAALQRSGAVSRVGAVIRPHTIGTSTLAAMAVPEGCMEAVAALVSAQPEVNHNYKREHRFNLWFVVTASDNAHLEDVLGRIEILSGLAVMDLPMLNDYFIDLGFELESS